MQIMPLCGHIPRLTYYRYFVHHEQFFQSESVQKEWLIFAVEEGSFYFEIGDSKATASFGDLVFCPPGVVFRRVVISPVSLFVLRMVWQDDEGQNIVQEKLGPIPVGKVSVRNTEQLLDIFSAFKRYSPLNDRWSRISRSHTLHHIWLLYCEEIDQLLHDGRAQPGDQLIQQAVKLIQLKAFERFSLHTVSQQVGLSRMQLCRRFQSVLGISPMKYLTSLRLEKAKRLLTETNLNLDQISECCGYLNGFYLSRVFKSNFHMTPIQYRKEHRL
jgi:AraC family transcriptional regulator